VLRDGNIEVESCVRCVCNHQYSVVPWTYGCVIFIEHASYYAGMTDGFDDATAYGQIDGIDDPSMGWARYAQSTKHMNLNSGLFYVRANENTLRLMLKLADRLSKQKYWDQTAFNEEIFFLSHGDTEFVPISVRVMDYWKFMNSKVRHRASQCIQPSASDMYLIVEIFIASDTQ
jgi:hypothetical protein